MLKEVHRVKRTKQVKNRVKVKVLKLVSGFNQVVRVRKAGKLQPNLTGNKVKLSFRFSSKKEEFLDKKVELKPRRT